MTTFLAPPDGKRGWHEVRQADKPPRRMFWNGDAWAHNQDDEWWKHVRLPIAGIDPWSYVGPCPAPDSP